MMNEQCWMLVGGINGDLWWGEKFGPQSEGTPASVAFDPDFVIKREEEHGDVVGFIHTHPSFTAHYSMRDDRTMKAWVLSLGKPLVCCIIGTDGLRAFWYNNDEDPPTEETVHSLRGAIFGLTPPEDFEPEKQDFADLLMDEDPPSLGVNQLVKVIAGKHQGSEGRAQFYRTEGNGGRIKLRLEDGKEIYVDKEEIDLKFDYVESDLMMEEEEREAYYQYINEIREGEYLS